MGWFCVFLEAHVQMAKVHIICSIQNPASAHGGRDGETSLMQRKQPSHLIFRDSLVPHRKTVKSSASNSGGLFRPASGVHFTSSSHLQEKQPLHCPLVGLAVLPSPLLGIRVRSRSIDSHELTGSPWSSAPAPCWAMNATVSTANSHKQPERDQDFRCRRRGRE